MWKGKRYVIDAPYCVKVEFHQSGWTHFHVVFLTRRYLPPELLKSLWSLGHPNARRIRNKIFHYLLKYVTKGGDRPAWVLGRHRLRVFQTSRGFYKPTEETQSDDPAGKTGCKRRQSTLGERLHRWRMSALLPKGTEFRQILPGASFMELLADFILPVALDRRYLGNGHIIINDTKDLIPWITNTPPSAPEDCMSAA